MKSRLVKEAILATLLILCIILYFILLAEKKRAAEQDADVILEPQAGIFATVDRVNRSFYITRVVEENGYISRVCIIQPSIPEGFFENCVISEQFYDFMQLNQGYYSREAKYRY